MSEYTPGPWNIEKVRSDHARIWGPENTFVAETYRPHGKLFPSWANAQLIAAAPELLEALQQLVDDCIHASGSMDYNYGEFDLKAAEAAILKAKGKKL